ncbi:HK97 gp10 family phage protein [Brucella intermedia]|uniref:HK97 gp10 family phage protein n=1 Tax=Brucella intermedia TaxID=94625 RepID=UPI00224B33ED|nr:HK97 gp10 family phage protein [Brucella intermedia]
MAVKVKGLDRLQIKLKKFPEVAENLVRAAMEQGAQEIVNMMQNLVPVDDGELMESIGWAWGTAPKYSQRIGSVKSNDGKLTITIYAGNSKVRYAHLVEWGARRTSTVACIQVRSIPGQRHSRFSMSRGGRSGAAHGPECRVRLPRQPNR